MVRHVNPLNAVIERNCRVLGGGDPLEDQRNPVLVLDQLDGAPLKPSLEVTTGRAKAAFPHVTLGDVALAPAVMSGVDGEAECCIAVGDGATDAVFDKGVVAANIELINPQRIGRCLSDFLQTGFG